MSQAIYRCLEYLRFVFSLATIHVAYKYTNFQFSREYSASQPGSWLALLVGCFSCNLLVRVAASMSILMLELVIAKTLASAAMRAPLE